MSVVFKYRMLVQVRTDLTPEEIASRATRPKMSNEIGWPFRDTGEIIHARRRKTACAFYRALRRIDPLIRIRAIRINESRSARRNDAVQFRAWRGFECLIGSVNGLEDEVRHFAALGCAFGGRTSCGLEFTTHCVTYGKPECDKCLAAAVERHPDMKQYL